jgi:hypothetical protein
MSNFLIKPVLSQGAHEMGPAAESNLADTKTLSDAEWASAAARIRETVETYRELDVGALAQEAAEQYIAGRNLNDAAYAATMAMLEDSDVWSPWRARVREIIRTYALFLAPIAIMLLVSFGVAEFVGWSVVPTIGLSALYCAGILVALAIGTMAFLSGREGPFAQLRSLHSLLLTAGAGVAAASIAGPITIQAMRVSEQSILAQASSTLQQTIASYLAIKSAGISQPDSSLKYVANVPGLSVTPTSGGAAYTFDAPGLPGELRAEIKGSSGRVYWKTIMGNETLQSRIEVGKFEKLSEGSVKLVKSNQESIGPITVRSDFVLTGGSVAAVLDSKEDKLLAVMPVLSEPPK